MKLEKSKQTVNELCWLIALVLIEKRKWVRVPLISVSECVKRIRELAFDYQRKKERRRKVICWNLYKQRERSIDDQNRKMSSYWYYPNYVVPNQFYESSSSTCSSPSYVEYSNENSPTRSSVYNQCSCCCYVEPTSSPTIVTRPSTQLPNRLQYSVRQRWLLNEIYQHVPYPNSVQKSIIADRIGATREQIRKFEPTNRKLLNWKKWTLAFFSRDLVSKSTTNRCPESTFKLSTVTNSFCQWFIFSSSTINVSIERFGTSSKCTTKIEKKITVFLSSTFSFDQ